MLGKDAEIELTVGEAVSSGLYIPFGGKRVVDLAVPTPARPDGEIVHGLDVALLRGGLIPGPRPAKIFGDALAALIHGGKTVLGRRKACACGAFEPACRFGPGSRAALGRRRSGARWYWARASPPEAASRKADRPSSAGGSGKLAGTTGEEGLGRHCRGRSRVGVLDGEDDARRGRGGLGRFQRGELRPADGSSAIARRAVR